MKRRILNRNQKVKSLKLKKTSIFLSLNTLIMDYNLFEQKIDVVFKDKGFLKIAFTHRSALNESKSLKEHNERLEFLGDAVLELVTTEYLYLNYDSPEGELTNLRSSIVKKETLAEVARDINVGEYLILSKGEKASGGQDKDYILANTIESIIGAIYLDLGYDIAKHFIHKFIVVKLKKIIEEGKHIDSKSYFQEKSQEILSITPEYKLLFEEGPDHNKIFTMGIYLNEELISQGQGSSKQIAEQEAAKGAIAVKKWK